MNPQKRSPRPGSLAASGDGGRDSGLSICSHGKDSLVGCDRQQVRGAAVRDAKWFTQNPGRVYRFRRARSREMPGTRKEQWIVVKQLSPGVRIRLAVDIAGTGWIAPTTDEELGRLFDAVSGGKPIAIVDGRIVPIASVYRDGGNA